MLPSIFKFHSASELSVSQLFFLSVSFIHSFLLVLLRFASDFCLQLLLPPWMEAEKGHSWVRDITSHLSPSFFTLSPLLDPLFAFGIFFLFSPVFFSPDMTPLFPVFHFFIAKKKKKIISSFNPSTFNNVFIFIR